MFTTKPNMLGFGEFKVNISLYLYRLNDFYYLCKGPWIYSPTHKLLNHQTWLKNPYILRCLLKINFLHYNKDIKNFSFYCVIKKNIQHYLCECSWSSNEFTSLYCNGYKQSVVLTNKTSFFMLFSKTSAKLRVLFTLFTLIIGGFWGKLVCGTFWVWDACLTYVLILFIYLPRCIAFSRVFLWTLLSFLFK